MVRLGTNPGLAATTACFVVDRGSLLCVWRWVLLLLTVGSISRLTNRPTRASPLACIGFIILTRTLLLACVLTLW